MRRKIKPWMTVLLMKKSKGNKAKVTMVKGNEGSASFDEEGLYVPGWNMKSSDNFKSSAICEEVLAHFATPGAKACLEGLDDDALLAKMMVGTCNLAAMLPEGISRFRKVMGKYSDFAKKKREMKQSIADMKRDAEEYAKKEVTLISLIDELKKGHEAEMARHEAAILKVEADQLALEADKKAFESEKKGLEEYAKKEVTLISLIDDLKKGHEAEMARHEAAILKVEADQLALEADKKAFESEKKGLE